MVRSFCSTGCGIFDNGSILGLLDRQILTGPPLQTPIEHKQTNRNPNDNVPITSPLNLYLRCPTIHLQSIRFLKYIQFCYTVLKIWCNNSNNINMYFRVYNYI